MANNEFGALLRATRIAKLATLADVADHLGVKISYLSNVELGREAPLSPERIEAVSAMLDVEPAPLLRAAAKSRTRFTIDNPSSLVAREALQGLARTPDMSDTDFWQMVRDLAKRSKKGLNIELFERRGIATSPMSKVEVESRAGIARRHLQLPITGRVDLAVLFDCIGEHSIHAGALTVPLFAHVDESLPVEGRSTFAKDLNGIEIALREDTYRALLAHNGRARFCVAHELGHAFMHFRELVRMTFLPHEALAGLARTGKSHKTYEDTEWQANAFGGAFIAPRTDAQLALAKTNGGVVAAAWQLAASHGLSEEAATRRVRDVAGQ